jgi:hypothetical protein
MPSTTTDLDHLKCLILSKTSELETGAKNQNSKYGENVGKTSRQGLLYTE